MPFSGKLSLREAIERGLNYNLGAVGQSNAVRQAQGQSQVARSALLPNASGYLAETLQQISLSAEGLRITIPGFTIPPTIGPFNNMDLRGSLSQSILDLSSWNNYRSSRDVFRASQVAALGDATVSRNRLLPGCWAMTSEDIPECLKPRMPGRALMGVRFSHGT
jgi:outer membrane protein TolC